MPCYKSAPSIPYLLLYRTPKWVGRFSGFANEVLLCNHHKLIWDQVAAPATMGLEPLRWISNHVPKANLWAISRFSGCC
jgi:hypothetical protein